MQFLRNYSCELVRQFFYRELKSSLQIFLKIRFVAARKRCSGPSRETEGHFSSRTSDVKTRGDDDVCDGVLVSPSRPSARHRGPQPQRRSAISSGLAGSLGLEAEGQRGSDGGREEGLGQDFVGQRPRISAIHGPHRFEREVSVPFLKYVQIIFGTSRHPSSASTQQIRFSSSGMTLHHLKKYYSSIIFFIASFLLDIILSSAASP